MTEGNENTDLDLSTRAGRAAASQAQADVQASADLPTPEPDVQLRLVHGRADRFQFFTTEQVDGPNGPVQVENTHYVTHEPSSVPAGEADRVIESAAGVGLIIEKVEA